MGSNTCDSSDGNFSNFITFTRTYVHYYIHAHRYARGLRKVVSFPSLPSLISEKKVFYKNMYPCTITGRKQRCTGRLRHGTCSVNLYHTCTILLLFNQNQEKPRSLRSLKNRLRIEKNAIWCQPVFFVFLLKSFYVRQDIG